MNSSKFLTQNQVHFLQSVKKNVPNGQSKIEVLSNLLSIDINTMYKRMVGKTPLTLHEACLLSTNFQVPLETLFENEPEYNHPFKIVSHNGYIKSLTDFKSYLKNINQSLHYIITDKSNQLYYSAKDIPIFYFFADPLTASFKIWYWLKHVCNIEEFKNVQFDKDIIDQEILDIANDCYQQYISIHVTEMWNENTAYAIFSQIEESVESNLLDINTANLLIDKLLLILVDLKQQAAMGYRNSIAKYELLYNKTLIMDNSLMASVKGQNYYYIPHTGIHYLVSNDKEMTAEYLEWFLNQMQKSVFLSRGSEKFRENLFRPIFEKLDSLKNDLVG